MNPQKGTMTFVQLLISSSKNETAFQTNMEIICCPLSINNTVSWDLVFYVLADLVLQIITNPIQSYCSTYEHDPVPEPRFYASRLQPLW